MTHPIKDFELLVAIANEIMMKSKACYHKLLFCNRNNGSIEVSRNNWATILVFSSELVNIVTHEPFHLHDTSVIEPFRINHFLVLPFIQ